MKHVSILVPKGAHPGCIDGTHQVMSEANFYLSQQGKDPVFDIHLVGLTNETELKNGLFVIRPDVMITDVKQTDLIIIPAPFYMDFEQTISANKDFIAFIADQYKKGACVASLCVGTFLLAASGLLEGKKCSTHWMHAADFRRLFPDIDLVTDKIITDENGIYTSGGALSYMNLILYLIEKYAGRETAIHCSKVFEVDINRGSQSPFIMFRGQKTHEDEPVKQVQQYIEQHFQDRITVDQLASLVSIGRRNLERRFKKATSNTVVEYMQRVKIEAAKMSFESTRENINEVMYKVGYTDTKTFRSTFKKITGLSPIDYRNRFKVAH